MNSEIRFDLIDEPDTDENDEEYEDDDEIVFDCGCFEGNEIVFIEDPENLDKMPNCLMN